MDIFEGLSERQREAVETIDERQKISLNGSDKSKLLDLLKNPNFKEIQTFIQICR